MTIATLGISVDSSAVTKATSALDGLTAAAKPAANAAQGLSDASKDAANAHAGMSTQAMAAQHSIRSMVEAIASGQPVTQALTQQMNHLSYAATGPGGLSAAFKGAIGSITGLLSPVTLVVAGLAVLVGGTALAIHSMAQTGKQFDDTASQAGTTTSALHALADAASFKGISNADFLKSMDKFAGSVYDAQHGMGSLAETFRANSTSAKTFNDYMAKAADLIKNAGSDQQRLQILQQMGLPATMDWVRFLGQGADGIKAATKAAADFNASAEGQLVAKAREFDEEWNKAWTNFSTNARSAFLTALQAGSGLFDKMESLANRAGNASFWKGLYDADGAAKAGVTLLNGFNQRFTGDSANPAANNKALQSGLQDAARNKNNSATVDPNVLKDQISKQQQYIGLLGSTATAEDAVKQAQLTRQAASLQGIHITDQQETALEKLAYERASGIAQIKAQTDSQNIEIATVGMSVGATAQYTAVQNALNTAKQNGTKLSPETVAQINKEASALGDAAQTADLMKSAYTGLVQGPLQTLTQQIGQGAKFFDALKAAGISALNSIASKLADMAAQNLWSSAFGGSTGGAGSFFANLFGGGSAGSGSAPTAVVGAFGPNAAVTFAADGGHISGPGTGTSDSINARLSNGEFVVNAAATSANLPLLHSINNGIRGFAAGGPVGSAGNDNGGGQQNTHITFGVEMDQNGNLQAYVKNISQKEAGTALSGYVGGKQFPKDVSAARNKGAQLRLK